MKRNVFYSWDHLGDNIDINTVAHNYYECIGQKLLYNPKQYSAVFENNPYIELTDAEPEVRIEYTGSQRTGDMGNTIEGFTKSIALKTDLPVEPRYIYPQIYVQNLTPVIEGSYVVIQTGWYEKCSTKNMGRMQWQDLINKNPDIKFVQAGVCNETNHQPTLYGDNLVSLVNRTSFKEYIALLKHAQFAVGPVSCFSHICPVYGVQCMVVVGNREAVCLTAFPGVHHIVNPVSCGPCMKFRAYGVEQPKCCPNVMNVDQEVIAQCMIIDLNKEFHKVYDEVININK